MRTRIKAYLASHPFGAGVIAALGIMIGGASLAAGANHVHPFIPGTVDYEASTSGPVIYGLNSGSGLAIEGVTNTNAPAGAIALQGFGTSTTLASVGVNGAVSGPGSTALIGNANATSGAPSIGLEGFSKTGEGVFAQTLSSGFPSFRSVDGSAFYNVLLSDTPNGDSILAQLNTNSGGAAVYGQDTVVASNFNIGVLGTTLSGDFGVEGTAAGDAPAAVFGSSTATIGSAYGVEGLSTNGPGVFGTSTNNDGIHGYTANPSGTQSGRSGGYFLDNSSDSGTGNFGITAQSADGTGIQGNQTNAAVVGTGVLGTAAGVGTGVLGTTVNHIAVLGEGAVNTSAVGTWGWAPFGVVAECAEPGGTDEIYGEDNGSNNFTVNCSGVPSAFLRTRHNMYVNPTFEKSTQSVIEDYGEAQLVNGVATVKLESAFAESLTDRAPYLVFVTPDGDTNGLYVTNKTLHGFEVHEVRGGRSTLTFDYRIVGHPTSDGYTRMALASSPPRAPQVPEDRRFAGQRAQVMLAQHLAAFQRGQVKLARSHTRPAPAVMPIYEPRMGPNGKLIPGKAYVPPTRPHQ